jgi:hypothetical protein
MSSIVEFSNRYKAVATGHDQLCEVPNRGTAEA